MKILSWVTLLVSLWYFLMWGANVAGANEYNKAVIGHVIKEKVTGGNIDTSKLMENELQKLAHQFTIESIVILQKYLPSILDGIAADLRLKADKEYKCKLLKGSPNGCKE